MRAQRSCWLVVASALVCLPMSSGATNSFGQEPLPPEVAELFTALGIEVDDQGIPVPPPLEVQPFVPSTIDPAEDPLGFFDSLGIPIEDVTVVPAPSPPAPPAPVSTVEPTPLVPSPAELELFGLLGLEFDDEGNLLPPGRPEALVTPTVVIDTEQEMIDFFASIGLTIDADGNPIPPAPPVSQPPTVPTDPNELLLSLGLPVELLDAPSAPVTSAALSIPEPSSAILALGIVVGLLTRRGQRR